MVRIADIFKNVKDASPSLKKEDSVEPVPVRTEKPAIVSNADTPKENLRKPLMPLISEAIKSTQVNKSGIATGVYQEALRLSQTIFEKAKTGDMITGKEVQKTVDDITSELTYDNTELLNLACNQVLKEEVSETDFLAAKMVNKTVLAIEIGIGKKWNRSQLFQLGTAAFFSDLGIVKVLDIVTKKEILTAQDWARLREVPYKTVEILKKIPDLSHVVLTVAKESHERSDGSGPLGIRDIKELDGFSRIVAVIDAFEALTHDRPHRPRKLPHEAMKIILHDGEKFESDVLRLLIDRIGIYPIGSWVQLTNKEYAKITGSNPGWPLRPKVKVMFDAYGSLMNEPHFIDLAVTRSIQVLQPVSDKDLKKLMEENPY
ncbi:MAG: hypothetical protein HY877_04120 [Deltaproteobacteria bacterium]|nr:hypothetical protein [Deltaproteobacteria bacterium]